MQSLTNQKSNRIASRATTWLMALVLAVGCRERVAVEQVSSHAPSFAPLSPSQIEPFDADLDRLLACIRNRLSLMPAVARYKWEHELPIEDIERERSLINRFVDDARTHGLNTNWPRRVIVAGTDVTGVELKLLPLSSIAGKVVIEERKAAERTSTCENKRNAFVFLN